MSGVAVAALVVAAIAAAVVITMLIINSQQKTSDDQLAQERARSAAAQQMPAQPAQQQPVIVNMPPSQPAPMAVPVAAPAQPPPSDARTAPSSASVEIDVTSRLQNDEELRTYAIDVKVSGGTTTLSGNVPDEDLKKRAGKLAKSVNGVQNIINNIAVRP
jgi:osmotically-inducible protein OsmY